MNVYIANFGKGNWAWPECLARPAIAAMDDERVHRFWQSGDREGYIQEAQRFLQLTSGQPVTKTVASRWFNVNTILHETADDLWIHREKQEMWWTHSTSAEPEVELIDDPRPHAGTKKIFVYYKRCASWSSRTKKGAPLLWGALHARAREFLFTEGTFNKLSPDHAAYATALVEGRDLGLWHRRPEWEQKQANSKRGSGITFDSRRKTIVRMAQTAWDTVSQSGATTVTVRKDKRFGFQNRIDLEMYLDELLASQERLCALTGLTMLFDDEEGDRELVCSLDRIDSNGHYDRGNLQVVCRFANRWKGAGDNSVFLALVEKIRLNEDA